MKKEDALKIDDNDQLSYLKKEFLYGDDNEEKKIYFCGNSLGLQHNSLKNKINEHLEQWKKFAVENHFNGDYPWMDIQDKIKEKLKLFLGCSENEIAIMNSLSVNLHLMMVSFYKPSKTKNKILIEENAFSSDRYVVNSQLKHHGLNESSLLTVYPEEDYSINEDKIISKIINNNESLSLVLLPGIQYYNGQVLNIPKISKVCKDNDITLGLDLAHMVGNVKVDLNSYDVDFATWCSYKYLNSGPGGVSGIYVNSRHINNDIVRFEGWWGNKLSSRFEMLKKYDPEHSAEAWVLSNPPVVLLDIHLASLEVFSNAGLDKIFNKSKLLSDFLYDGLNSIDNYSIFFDIITPVESARRGSQISLFFKKSSENFFNEISKKFVVDYRKPNVIRVAPVPLYNSFYEVYLFVKEIDRLVKSYN
ncbi:MAG: kynureninase [Amoebophilaceae bacterium TMED152]|nr:MAG: kynureninase [Amoebophilaceae bacterium TMED152]|tara:strand:- start:13205 stop:14458 length:1254 start_codon:yes stop_codon:yes gene_type:complete